MNPESIQAEWKNALRAEFSKPYFTQLVEFVKQQREEHEVFPPADDVFSAFDLTPLNRVRVLILGQDPYHDNDQAHGLCFSVQRGQKIPPSLRNIFKELQTDQNIPPAEHGCLESWAKQGVLLLNTVLTVQAHKANSHRKQGWETFTDRIIELVNNQPRVVFVLWGKPAQKKKTLITGEQHLIIEGPHPSPLSAHRGFFGSRPFSKINEFLKQHDQLPIDWNVADGG